MKTVIDKVMNAVNEFKGLGLSAVVGDKYLSSDGVTEKTINTYVHLFACDKEQLNDWSRAYTEFVWRINTGESPNFAGDVEWINKNGEAHKVSMKTLYWDLDIVKWRPVLKSDKELDVDIDWSKYDIEALLKDKPTPIFTQEMSDNGVLPSVGMECRAITNTITIGYVGNNFLVLVFPDGSDGTITHEEALEDLKPLTPPITLIDGECYQGIHKGNGKLYKGVYVKSADEICHGKYSNPARFYTNIQPLTVEVK
jgi:hypothetical protein